MEKGKEGKGKKKPFARYTIEKGVLAQMSGLKHYTGRKSGEWNKMGLFLH